MKKYCRSLILITLCIAACISLSACKKENKAETAVTQTQTREKTYPELTKEYVQGKWSARVYLDTLMQTSDTTLEENLNTQLENYSLTLEDLGLEVPDKLIMKYVIEFEGDKVIQYVERNETNDYFTFLDEFYGAVADYLSDPNVFALCFYENGMADLTAVAEEYGMTVEEFMEDEIEYVRTLAQTTLSDTNASFPDASFSINGNTLTVKSDVDSLDYNYDSGMLVTDSDGIALAFAKE